VDGRLAKGQATKAQIVETATTAFADAGYDGVSIETLVTLTGVSRGALYHHFNGKEGLFLAVLETVEERVARTIIEGSRAASDPVAALRAGCGAWLELARDPEVRQIVLTDAPAVLGWEKWRDLDRRYGFGLLRAALEAHARAGRLSETRVDMFAHILLAAVLEAALLVARDDDPPTRLEAAREAMDEFIERLLS
jgi:AcrR family transcriptional regulator